MKHITYWIIGIIALLIIGLSFYAGRKSVKPQVIDLSRTDTTIVFVPDTVKQTITKFIKAKKDTVFLDSSSQYQTYSELIDTTILLKEDSLDFVAEIVFNDSSKSFSNTFDFWLRAKQKIREVVRYVEVPMKPEIYQHPLVIILSIAVSFLLGLTIGG